MHNIASYGIKISIYIQDKVSLKGIYVQLWVTLLRDLYVRQDLDPFYQSILKAA